MLRKYNAPLYLTMLMAVTSCGNNHTGNADDVIGDTIAVATYAKGFTLSEGPDGIRFLSISDPQHEGKEKYNFALVRRGTTPEEGAIPEGFTVLEVPVSRIVCMTSLQLSNFITLGQTDKIVGITSTRHLFNEDLNRQLSSGHTSKIGIEGSFDVETVLSLQPEVILISPFKRGGYDELVETDVPLLPHLGYKETTPLGQAEWIKLIGILVGKESESVEKFNNIAQHYDSLVRLVDEVKQRPVVMSGEIRGGNWYAPGGQSFLASLMKDAGADYFLKDDTRSGGVTLDFETVYSQAENADYWRIVNSYAGDFSYDVLQDEEPRYADFRAFKNHGVIYCNMRLHPFYEKMPVEPDKMLADLIYIFHPDSLPGHTPEFYTILK